jgi:hypothetical protein
MKNYSIDLVVMMMTSRRASHNCCRAPIIWNKLAMDQIILARVTRPGRPGQVFSIVTRLKSFSNPPCASIRVFVMVRTTRSLWSLLLNTAASYATQKQFFVCLFLHRRNSSPVLSRAGRPGPKLSRRMEGQFGENAEENHSHVVCRGRSWGDSWVALPRRRFITRVNR